MNTRFLPLFDYVVSLDLLKQLLDEEIKTWGGLSDLVFSVQYSHDVVGHGTVSAYRISANGSGAIIKPELDLMRKKIWFVENEVWRIETLSGRRVTTRYPQRFDALSSVLHDYRPVIRVNEDKPMLKIQATQIPYLDPFSAKPKIVAGLNTSFDHLSDQFSVPLQFAARHRKTVGQAELL